MAYGQFGWKRIVVLLTAGWLVVAGCSSDHFTSQPLTCASGKTACGGSCVDISSDPDHCGSCDNACQPGQVCSQGACALSCGGGTTKCADRCVDVSLDPQNCGTCGNACSSKQVCSGGTCAGTCGDGLTKCGGDAGLAYCANTQSDNANCGSCGIACTGGQMCSGGTCTTSCSAGLTKCGGDGGPTYCANTQSDNTNCGSCGIACTAGQMCSGGTCTTSCSAGLTKCGGDGGPTYCANTQSDNTNCGSCGRQCGAGEVCASGNCVLGCPTGQIACNGACIDPNNNSAYCGATQGCGADAGSAGSTCNATQECAGGKCVAVLTLPSYIFTGGLDASITTPRDEHFVLVGTPLLPTATIYYTTDGSTPVPGASGTNKGTSPVSLTAGESDTTIRWYADYGAPFGREPTTHRFDVTNTSTHNHGAIVENFKFGNGLPDIAVSAGASLQATFNYQAWHSDPTGYCYGCVDFFFVAVAGQQLECDSVAATDTYPGIQGTKTLTFNAPGKAGVYFIRGGTALKLTCSDALTHIADLPPIGVVVVK